MNKLFKFFMLFTLSLSILVVSCKDDENPDPGVPQPTITSVSPTSGEPGTVVTITGTNLQDVNRVTFGGTNAEGFVASNNTATTVTATVPAGLTAGAQNIVVTSPGGTATANFTVVEGGTDPVAPTITSFDPMSGAVGQEVTITGTGLNDVDSAMIGDVRITDWEVAEDGNTATFTIPEGAVTGTFSLYNPAGDPVVSEGEFTVGDAATTTITSFSPMTAPVGDAVTITGTGFDADAIASVWIGETEVTEFEIVDGNTITFTIPEGAETGPISIVFVDENMVDVVSIDNLTVGEPFATITSFEPMTGAVGQTVTITGTNLNTATSAMIGNVEITDWEAADDGTTATFTIPEGATTNTIIIENEDGARVASIDQFTIGETADPTIGTIEPARGIAGYPITITGENLSDVTAVTVGGQEAEFAYNETDNNISFTIPEGIEPGEAIEVVVTGANDVTATSTEFTVDDPATYPTVTELDITEGAVGDVVTVTGTNLEGATVTFTGGAEAEIDPTSTTETLVFSIPEEAESGPITITLADGSYVYTEDFTVGEAAEGGE